jgi:predicted nucleic acid-binding protein
MLLVDTNVLVDVLQNDPQWADWSISQMRAQATLELREIPRPAAHAAVEGWPLLTRDASRFKTCFPTLEVLAP